MTILSFRPSSPLRGEASGEICKKHLTVHGPSVPSCVIARSAFGGPWQSQSLHFRKHRVCSAHHLLYHVDNTTITKHDARPHLTCSSVTCLLFFEGTSRLLAPGTVGGRHSYEKPALPVPSAVEGVCTECNRSVEGFIWGFFF
jgi:hypothetical protein